jgi:hypothetical protein
MVDRRASVAAGLYIDPYGGAKRAVITHSHSDHARR